MAVISDLYFLFSAFEISAFSHTFQRPIALVAADVRRLTQAWSVVPESLGPLVRGQ